MADLPILDIYLYGLSGVVIRSIPLGDGRVQLHIGRPGRLGLKLDKETATGNRTRSTSTDREGALTATSAWWRLLEDGGRRPITTFPWWTPARPVEGRASRSTESRSVRQDARAAPMGKIAWLGDHGLTLNPGIYGCSPVGAGCDHCYAARMARRLVAMGRYPKGVVTPDGCWTGEVFYDFAADMETRIRKMPRLRSGERRRVFVTSMGDWLHERIPLLHSGRMLRAMEKRSDIDWIVVTKRAERLPLLVHELDWGPLVLRGSEWPPNVWPLVSVWDQDSADRMVPHLLQVPARVPGLSIEPLLGPVDLDLGTSPTLEPWAYCESQECAGRSRRGITIDCDVEPCDDWKAWRDQPRIAWVIVGGESGPHARPMHPDWVRSIRDQCTEAGVPFFFKQWGEWANWASLPGNPPPMDTDILLDRYGVRHPLDAMATNGRYMRRVGRAAAGRVLDGCTWEEEPDGR